MVQDEIVVMPKKEWEESAEQIKSLEEKCKKMKSEFTRYKQRVEEEEEEAREKVREDLVHQLLTVADSLDRAVGIGTDKDGTNRGGGEGYCEVVEKIVEGTRNNLGMTYNQLLDALEVSPIVPSAGDRFNDELHSAIETVPNGLLPDKTVISVVRKGYKMNGELIRPAEVVISRRAETEAEAEVEKAKPYGGFLAPFFKFIAARLLQPKVKELEERERELSKNEEMLKRSADELDAREEELKRKMEEEVKRREAEESRVKELEWRKGDLSNRVEELKQQLAFIYADLREKEAKKDRIAVEAIALNRFNEEISRENEELERSKELMIAELQKREGLKETIQELQPRKEELREEIEGLKMQLSGIYAKVKEMEREKDLLGSDNLELKRNNEELLEEKEEFERKKRLLNAEIEEMEKIKRESEQILFRGL
jgi:molecular chaperone GrpE (heat shock protein)